MSASTVWEVRRDGSDSNAGGFVAGASGTDRSQQAAAHATLTAASTVNATTTIIDVAVGDYTITAADVGNILQITGGTATAGFYHITAADTVNNRWTVDRAAGTAGQTVVGAMGGALLSPALAGSTTSGSAKVAGNTIWLKYSATTYDISNATANVAGGRIDANAASLRYEGYETTRGDLSANRPTLKATVNSITIFTESSGFGVFGNFNVDGGTATTIVGVTTGTATVTHRVHATNCSGTAAINCLAGSAVLLCSAQANSVAGFRMNGGTAIGCAVRGESGFGFESAAAHNTCVFCITDLQNNAPGFSNTGVGATMSCVNCTAYGGATTSNADGFANPTSNYAAHWVNCLADTNTGTGIGKSNITTAHNCAALGNGTNFGVNCLQFGTVTYGSGPFKSAAFHDFALNNTANLGRALRAAGLPSAFPSVVSTTSYIDVGAAQHQDDGSGATINSVYALLALPNMWDIET